MTQLNITLGVFLVPLSMSLTPSPHTHTRHVNSNHKLHYLVLQKRVYQVFLGFVQEFRVSWNRASLQVLYIVWDCLPKNNIQFKKEGRYMLCLCSHISMIVGWPSFWNLGSEKRKCILGDPKRSSEQHENRNLRIQCLEKDPKFKTKA